MVLLVGSVVHPALIGEGIENSLVRMLGIPAVHAADPEAGPCGAMRKPGRMPSAIQAAVARAFGEKVNNER